MTINTLVWRLAARILISTVIFNTILSNKTHVVAELSVTPLWNITANETDVTSCSLGTDNDLQGVFKLTGDRVQTCSVQLTSSNGTAALIRIPQGVVGVCREAREQTRAVKRNMSSVTTDETLFLCVLAPKTTVYFCRWRATMAAVSISVKYL